MNDGRYFYQMAYLPDSIDGVYTFKTSDNNYHMLSYMISHPFSDFADQESGVSELNVGCMLLTDYTIADEDSYYVDQTEIAVVNGEQKRLIYFFDSNGIHIKGSDLII